MFAFVLVTAGANAVVIRSDVPDSQYLVSENALPALADLPGEGQGTLIAPRWVVTAAHATQGYMLMRVRIHGEWRSVSHVFLYPGFKKDYDKVKQAAEHPSVKNWPAIKSAFESMHDIALIELAKPVEGVKPVALYRASNEQGEIVKLFGKGATGNGKVGEYPHSSHRGQLRRAYNRVTKVHKQWLDYRFDCGSKALALEGVLGDGDSGGPVLIKVDGEWELAGLADWKHWPKGHSRFVPGVCGQVFSNSRISYYANWINHVIAIHARHVKKPNA
ncbi:MAG TPA: trypsin-like serine protease [Oleiagrimonas sp.]|nr:trypsin-like serine protease [Oleiagrimonas sp.]